MSDKKDLMDEQLKFATDIAYKNLNNNKQNRAFWKEEEQLYVSEILKDDDKINHFNASNWKIVHTFDKNGPGESGFYGVVIDTGNGLIVSFRGSEDPSYLQNIHQDWIGADIGLIKGKLTAQQEDANKFLRELKQLGYFDKYDDITFAGHSLGGNLAEHSTFYAAELGVIDRIKRTISYDGPGFSQEYLELYKKNIEIATRTVDMDHVEQSLVGGLLQRVDGIHYFYAKLIGKGPVQHGTDNVAFDGSGKIIEGEQTTLSKFLTPFTQGMDRLISPEAAGTLVMVLTGITSAAWAIKDALVDQNGNLTTAGKVVVTGVVIGLVGMVITVGPIGVVLATAALAKMVLSLVVVAAVFVAAVIAYDFIMDQIEAFVDYMVNDLIPKVLDKVAETVGKFVNWSKEQLVEFGNMLAAGYKAFLDGLSHFFGAGPKVVATPHIKVDTYKLRRYAEQLERVKARISAVDSDLNILYLTEGFLDIINLAIAENLPTKSQMNQVIDYLQETATEFEAAEYRIMSI